LASFTAKAAALIEATVFAAARSCRLVFCWSFSLSSMLLKNDDDVVEEETKTALHVIIVRRNKRKQKVIVVVFKVVIISRKTCRRIASRRDERYKQKVVKVNCREMCVGFFSVFVKKNVTFQIISNAKTLDFLKGEKKRNLITFDK
jgi:hypothetical protein